jgi:hypothetical protein
LVFRKDVMPKRLQGMVVKFWRPDPAEARAWLHAVVDEALPRVTELAERLRVEDEQSVRAAAVDRALARAVPQEVQVVRALRSHERWFQQAARALLGIPGAWSVGRAPRDIAAPRREAPAALVDLPPLEAPPPARELVGDAPGFARRSRAS